MTVLDLVAGETAKIYSDSSCLVLLGTSAAAASGSSVDVTVTTAISPGLTTIYAKAFNASGVASSCSYVSLLYVYAPLPCDPALLNQYGGGAGTVGNPYRICNLGQWGYLADTSADWGKSFKLEANLDFTGITVANFKMVGNSTTAFTGNFDGNSYKIMNLSITGVGAETLALFPNTNGAVTISNLTLENVSMTAPLRLALLIRDHGASGPLTLSNITLTTCSLSPTATTGQNYNGMLVGRSNSAVTLNQITGTNLIITLPNNAQWSGGLIGATFAEIIANGITLEDSD